MRNLIIFLHTSADGFVEGPNGAMDIGFIRYDADLEGFANRVLASADTILWGKNTYTMMHEYWPTVKDSADATEHERNHANWIEQVEKVICSTTLNEVTWHNARLLQNDIIDRINQLKAQSGKDIVVLGSPRLAKYLLDHQLVDQLKLTVSPVLVGDGLRLFENVQSDLKLLSSETFDSGVLGLNYQMIKKTESI